MMGLDPCRLQQGGAIPVAEPSAEYNVASAPQDWWRCCNHGAVRMFPLDSTQIKFDEVRRERLFAYGSPASDALALLYHQWRLLNSWARSRPPSSTSCRWLAAAAIDCPVAALRIAVDARGYTRP